MSNDLIQCLMNLRKSDMQDNALHFDEKLPSSWSKDKMAEKLAQIYEENTEKFLSMLSLHALLFICEVFEQKINGQIPLSTNDKKARAMLDDVCPQLEVWGLVHYGIGRLHIAEFLGAFVSKRLPSVKDIAVEMQEMEECAIGIIIAYGFLEEEKFIEILRKCFPQIKAEHIRSFLYHRTNIFIDIIHVSVENSIWWFHHSIENMPDWYFAMEERKHIPYREYSKDEYIDIMYQGYVKKPKNFDKLAKILQRQGMSKEDAEVCLILEAVEHGCQLDIGQSVPELVQGLVWNSEEDLKQFVDLFMMFLNDTPLWFNKGFTPEELSKNMFNRIPPHSFVSKSNVIAFPKKTGRNEPCPCGSGKKYKNCCGKDDQEE